MTRQRSRKLFSRILWFDQDVGSDTAAGTEAVSNPAPEPPAAPVPEVRADVPVPRRVRSRILSMEPQPASQGEIYTEHFGLTSRPFALTPDPDFLYWPQSHQRAYTMLEYGIRANSPITLITGEVGAGKTTLLLHLIRSLGPEIRVGLISNPHGSRAELLRWVLHALEQPADLNESYVDLFSRFQNFLLSEYAAGRSVVLIFDEAQNLTAEALEELRMFININSGKDEVLQLVLIGQPELRDLVSQPNMRQFAQRVAASYHLTAMDLKTVRGYIPHRLKVAGAQKRIFTRPAIDLVHQVTRGVPRLVNQLCDLALVYAFTRGKRTVTPATVQQVLDDGVFFSANASRHTSET
ncbi:ExeA family protein [Tabrizicola sp.]|uniref:ExeA family protein n=1 Tax=Tabrizicola sp. TaxID=2005166 RepID=UPI00273580BB|nr:AAA family ATPase [Tabrizicola sp.]MDP3194718.1 AAA family ATPase [Tabrizicola sp.]